MAERPWHVLKSAKGEALPRVCVFVDTESWERPVAGTLDVREHSFRLGVAVVCWLSAGSVSQRQVLFFATTEEFWKLLQTVAPRDGLAWIFAHNLGFDFTMLGGWRRLEGADVKLRLLVLEDPPSILTYSSGRRTFQWVDTLNYWRLPLATLGTDIGRRKLDRPSQGAAALDWFAYCENDVLILEELVCGLVKFVKETLSCSFRATAAALAWCAWRTCSTFPTVVIHGNQRALKLERKALFGGRLACSRLGSIKEPVAALDVTSLYPHVMACRPLPWKLVSLVNNPTKSDFRAYLREYLCVAEVELDSDHPPMPRAVAGSRVFVRGAGRYVLCDPELRLCQNAAAIRAIYQCALYAAGDLSSGFVNPLLALKTESRRAGKLAQEVCCKLVLNGLTGKFAQKERKWIDEPNAVCVSKWGFWRARLGGDGPLVRMRSVAGVCQRLQEGGETNNSFPAVTALIASYGRVLLEGMCQVAGEKAVLYTDTDCLHVLPPGRSRLTAAGLVHPERVGSLRIIRTGSDAYYWGLKNYRIGEYRVLGAVSGTALEVADGVYLQDSFAGIQETIRSGSLDTIRVSTRTVRLSEASLQEQALYRPDMTQGERQDGQA